YLSSFILHFLLLSFSLSLPHPPRSTLFPYTTLFRSYMELHGMKDRDPETRSRKIPALVKVILVRNASQAPIIAASHISPRMPVRSEEHTSELQSRFDLVCRLLLEKKKKIKNKKHTNK